MCCHTSVDHHKSNVGVLLYSPPLFSFSNFHFGLCARLSIFEIVLPTKRFTPDPINSPMEPRDPCVVCMRYGSTQGSSWQIPLMLPEDLCATLRSTLTSSTNYLNRLKAQKWTLSYIALYYMLYEFEGISGILGQTGEIPNWAMPTLLETGVLLFILFHNCSHPGGP
jgi:hypothetical protein